jgi:hypothetical protein
MSNSYILRVRPLVISLLLPALAKHFHLFGWLTRGALEWHLMSRQHLGFGRHTTGKPPSTHLLLACSPVLLLVVAVGQLRILVYGKVNWASIHAIESDKPAQPVLKIRLSLRTSSAPSACSTSAIGRTSHRVHHRLGAVQLRRLLFDLSTY